MKALFRTLVLGAAMFLAAPVHHADAKVHHRRVVHHVHRVASIDAQRANAVAYQNSHPATIPQSAISHVRTRAHSVSYSAWRLTHPNQARAEAASEHAADARREAADRARMARMGRAQ